MPDALFNLKKIARQTPEFTKETKFTKALKTYGLTKCSAIGDALLIGLPADHISRKTVRHLPADTTCFGFLDGPEQIDLIRSFLSSPEAQTVTSLKIGTSHRGAVQGSEDGHEDGFDLRAVIDVLRQAQLPELRALSLGDMFLSRGQAQRFCDLGDVSDLFNIAPRLRMLDICGSFTLARPVAHPVLEEVLITQNTTVSLLGQDSLDHLLASKLPALVSLLVSIDGTNGRRFDISEGFDPDSLMPDLRSLMIDNLSQRSQQRKSALLDRLSWD